MIPMKNVMLSGCHAHFTANGKDDQSTWQSVHFDDLETHAEQAEAIDKISKAGSLLCKANVTAAETNGGGKKRSWILSELIIYLSDQRILQYWLERDERARTFC